MQINRSYYGADSAETILNDTVKTIEKKFNTDNYTLNTALDDSITATASTAPFAPYNNITYYNNWTDGILQNNTHTNDVQKLAFNTSNYKAYNYYEWYYFRWGYERTTYNGAQNFNFFSGYRFLNLIAKIFVTATEDSTTLTSLADVTDLTKISSVIIELYDNQGTLNEHSFSATSLSEREITLYDYGVEPKKDKMLFYTWWSILNNTREQSRYMTVIGNGKGLHETFYTRFFDTYSAQVVFNADMLNITDGGGYYKYNLKQSVTREDIYRVVATLGLPFTPTSKSFSDISNENCTDEDLYIPTITDDGFYNGDYTHGEDNKKQRQIIENWNNDFEAPFKHGAQDFTNIDKNKYSDKMERGTGRQASTFNNLYVCTCENLKALAKLLNVVDSAEQPAEIYQNMKFMGNNPMNAVTSINWFPFQIQRGNSNNIIIGSTTTNISVFDLYSTAIDIDMGFCSIVPIHKNHKYLNYEPYSAYFLYVPFCNWVKLDGKKIVGSEIHLYMSIDYLSGTVQCEIWINGIMDSTVSGVASNPIAIQAVDQTGYQNNRFSALEKSAGSVLNMVTSPASAMTSAIPFATGLSEFLLTAPEYNNAKAITAMLSTYLPSYPCIARYSVAETEPDDYKNSVGYACEFSDYLNNLSGYTVIHNFDTTAITATEEEKREIKTIVENGFYI